MRKTLSIRRSPPPNRNKTSMPGAFNESAVFDRPTDPPEEPPNRRKMNTFDEQFHLNSNAMDALNQLPDPSPSRSNQPSARDSAFPVKKPASRIPTHFRLRSPRKEQSSTRGRSPTPARGSSRRPLFIPEQKGSYKKQRTNPPSKGKEQNNSTNTGNVSKEPDINAASKGKNRDGSPLQSTHTLNSSTHDLIKDLYSGHQKKSKSLDKKMEKKFESLDTKMENVIDEVHATTVVRYILSRSIN